MIKLDLQPIFGNISRLKQKAPATTTGANYFTESLMMPQNNQELLLKLTKEAIKCLQDAEATGYISHQSSRLAINAILQASEKIARNEARDKECAIGACLFWMNEAVCFRIIKIEQANELQNLMRFMSTKDIYQLAGRLKEKVVSN